MGNKISTSSRKHRLLAPLRSSTSLTTKRKKNKQTPSPCSTAYSTATTASSISSNHSVTDSVVRQGRTFHNVSDSIYWLPQDDEEMDRLVGVCVYCVFFILYIIYIILFFFFNKKEETEKRRMKWESKFLICKIISN